MKITINRESFASVFQVAAAVAPQRSPKPILQNVKIDALNDSVVITATDMEVGVRLTADDVEISTPGSVVVPVARFGLILRELNDEKLTIDVSPEGAIVTGKTSRYELPVQDPDEFPPVEPFDDTSYVDIPARALKEMIRRTVFAADAENTRFALSGVLFEIGDDGSITAVGTDGRRLAKMEGTGTIVGEKPNENLMTIVPTRTLQLVERMLPDDDSVVSMAPHNNDLRFRTPKGMFYSRLVEGRFPKWRDVLPKQREAIKVEMMVGPLHSALRQAAIVVDAESRGVDFTFGGGNLVLSSKTAEIGESRIEVPIPYDGDEIGIALDHRFFADMLKVLPQDKQITLDVEGPDAAAYCTTDDGYGYVIMPLSRDRRR